MLKPLHNRWLLKRRIRARKIKLNRRNFKKSLSIPKPPPSLSKINNLKECLTAENLASFLGYSYFELSTLIYPSTCKQYYSFSIPKKSGGRRGINAPNKFLKKLQSKIQVELEKYHRPRNSTHGFIKDRSIMTNALQHTGKKYVLNIDLENFFESITFVRVRNLLCSLPFKFPYRVATVIAHICCRRQRLPQGSPVSPLISNMICYKLDRQLQELARKSCCTYSRYVDDITFSFNSSRNHVSKYIVGVSTTGGIEVGRLLEQVIKENGFEVNKDKVRFQEYSQRQEVTGLIVNEKINVNRTFVRSTFSMLYAWKKFGLIKAEKEYIDKFRAKSLKKHQKLKIAQGEGTFFQQVVKGRINYIKMIKGASDPIYKKLAYRLSDALGAPNNNYLKTPQDFATDSLFILDNNLDISQGTAFLLENIGIVTNWHVVQNIDIITANDIDLYRHHETWLKRKVYFLKASKKKDVAIFKTRSDFDDVKQLKVGDDSAIKQGDDVVIMGFPQYGGSDSPYVTYARVLKQRTTLGLEDMWLIDKQIFHGNSGGPVFNDKMEVIGVATAGAEETSGISLHNGFMPISKVLELAES